MMLPVSLLLCMLTIGQEFGESLCMTREEKIDIYQNRVRGAMLPNFVFFSREEQLAFNPLDLLDLTVDINPNPAPFIQNYNTHLAEAFASLLHWTLTGGPNFGLLNLQMTSLAYSPPIGAGNNQSSNSSNQTTSSQPSSNQSNQTYSGNNAQSSYRKRRDVANEETDINLNSYHPRRVQYDAETLKRMYLKRISDSLSEIQSNMMELSKIDENFKDGFPKRPKRKVQNRVHSRVRRSTNSNCLTKGSVGSNGKLVLCDLCVEQTQLASNMYDLLSTHLFVLTGLGILVVCTRIPQYITEIVCSTSDSSCLSGEGCCAQRQVVMTFLEDEGNGNYNTTFQAIRTGCECELEHGSVLAPYV